MTMIGMYCDRPPRGGIGNYARELHRSLRAITSVDLGFCRNNIPLEMSSTNAMGSSQNGEYPLFLAEGVSYFAIPEGEILSAGIHHGVDASLAWLVHKAKKSVITLHDILDDGRVELTGIVNRPFLEAEGVKDLKRADRIILDSYDAKSRALNTGIDEEKMRVVHLGVDRAVFYPGSGDASDLRKRIEEEIPTLKRVRGKKLILNVCSEEPRKRVEDVLRALAEVKKSISDVAVIRIGYPGVPPKPEISQLIEELGIMKDVLYIQDSVSLAQIANLYRIAYMQVLPTIREGFCLSFAEALASGCPVVAYNTTTAPEVVGAGGILVDYNSKSDENIAGLAKGISRLLSNPALRAEKSKKGLEQAKQFTWERCAKNTFDVYSEII